MEAMGYFCSISEVNFAGQLIKEAVMRTAQVSIHAKLLGPKQLSTDFVEEHGTVLDIHSYVDSNSFPEALMAAVIDVASQVEQARGFRFGVRRDLVSSDMEGEDAQLAKRLEPSRPVDVRDMRAITEMIERESGKETSDALVKQARLEQSLGSEIGYLRTYLDSEEFAEAPLEHKERFILAIRRQAEALQQLADGLA